MGVTGLRRSIASLVALLAAATACSSGGSSSSKSSSASPPTTPPSAPTTSTTAVPTSSTSPTTAISGPATCASAELTLTIGSPNGTAGRFYYPLALTSSSSHSCTLFGYPGASFVDASGSQIGVALTHEAATTPTAVTVPAGGKAYSNVGITDPGAAGCTAASPAKLRLYPPGNTVPIFVAVSGISSCATGTDVGSVYPISAASIP